MKTFGMIDLISNMEPADDVNKVLYYCMRDLPMLQVCAATYPHSTHVCNCRYTIYDAYDISSKFYQSKVNK